MPCLSDNTIPESLQLLDDCLQDSESRVSGIREGCEKKIVWHNNQRQPRDLAIVYLHGFSASRMETWPLFDRLAETIGANLFYTRLTGHGQDGRALAEATVKDWLNDGMEAVAIGRRLGGKIILAGMSTGATLAVWLAAQPSVAPLVHSLILLSPNFLPKNPLAALTLWPPALRGYERLFGGWRCFTVSNAVQAQYWTVRYPLQAVATMMKLVCLSWRTSLKNAGMPVLMMINPWDRVINVPLAITRFRGFSSPRKRLVMFTGNKDVGRHVLAGDILSPEATDKALGVLVRFLQNRVRE